MENTPLIHTKRLILRKFFSDEAGALYDLLSDPDVSRFLPILPLATRTDAETYLKQNYLDLYKKPSGFHYAICLKTDCTPIGFVNVADNDSFDLGYALQKAYWHQGIVTEACKAIIDHLIAAAIPYITATHDIRNPGSGNVMRKLGMRYCYSYEERWQPKNFLVTFRMYQLNLHDQDAPVYQKYWNMYPVHFIEKTL